MKFTVYAPWRVLAQSKGKKDSYIIYNIQSDARVLQKSNVKEPFF